MNSVVKKNILVVLIMFIIAALIILLFYLAFIKSLPDLLPVIKNGDEKEIAAFIQNTGKINGMLSLALLQIIQVISIFLPSVPIQIAAGIVYGWFRGFIICHLASTFTHAMIFFLIRKLDIGFEKMISEKKSITKMEFLIKSQFPGYMTAIAFLVPFVPNGILPYIAEKTRLTTFQYVIAVFFGNFIPVLLYCAIGNKILIGDYTIAVILFISMFSASILLFRFRDKILGFLKYLMPRLFNTDT